ncbi:MAG: hypothetical protein IJY23_06625 [Clostridia bacterium]|nr:hypothetical protein [Clostridia bacterium]
MITLVYKFIESKDFNVPSMFVLFDINEDGGEKIKISASEKKCEYILIGNNKYRMKNGEAEIELSDIEDGELNPEIAVGTKRYLASPFSKSGYEIKRCNLSADTEGVMSKLLYSISLSLNSATERIAYLEEKIKPKDLFKF